ncbi:unnamed protein product, partial [Gulo gulo]
GPDLKADLQKLPQAKAGHVTGYHPDVNGRNLPFLESIKMPGAGMLSIDGEKYEGLFLNIIYLFVYI